MIVKDEEQVIRRCLASVRPLIDAWCIVDTGSSDRTKDVVLELLGDLPGALYERPWRDFGHNRTEALDLARPWADYALIIDADETLEVPPGFRFPQLEADGYLTRHRRSGSSMSFHRMQVVKTLKPWRYVGVLHELITCDEPHVEQTMDGLTCVGHFDSARNRMDAREKYRRDAQVLEKALIDEPDNARYVFYLAQSYRDAGDPREAIDAYRRRASMGGWQEEVFYSLLQLGLLCEREGRELEAVGSLLGAYQRRPGRRESLVELARLYRTRNQHHLAYLFAKRAVAIARPDDRLFVDDSAYTYRAEDELSIAAYWVGEYRESIEYANRVLAEPSLPAAQRARVEKNRQFAVDKLASGEVNRAMSLPASKVLRSRSVAPF